MLSKNKLIYMYKRVVHKCTCHLCMVIPALLLVTTYCGVSLCG